MSDKWISHDAVYALIKSVMPNFWTYKVGDKVLYNRDGEPKIGVITDLRLYDTYHYLPEYRIKYGKSDWDTDFVDEKDVLGLDGENKISKWIKAKEEFDEIREKYIKTKERLDGIMKYR